MSNEYKESRRQSRELPELKMRFYKFMNSILYLKIQLVAKESKAKENDNKVFRFLFVLFIHGRRMAQFFHFKTRFSCINKCRNVFS